MVKDYYSMLRVTPNASPDDIRNAYRKLALNYQLQKTKTNNSEAFFKKICTAYEVLIDPQKRKIYDTKGLDGLRPFNVSESGEGLPDPDPMETARKLFGTQIHKRVSSQDRFPIRSHMSNISHRSTSRNDRPIKEDSPSVAKQEDSPIATPSKPRNIPIEHDVYVSLDQLKSGCTKRMRILRQREKIPGSGNLQDDEVVLTLTIPAGCPRGTKIIFPQEGQQYIGEKPSDVVFTILDRDHPLFRRNGSDLTSKITIGIRLALLGGEVKVNGLCGEKWTVTVPCNTETGDKYRIRGAGLPNPSDENLNARGDIILIFEVRMPETPFKNRALHKLANLLPAMTPTQSIPQEITNSMEK